MSIKRKHSGQIVVATALIALILGCGFSSPCHDTELERIKSPDNKVEVVLVQRDCGATTSKSFNVFVVGTGKKTQADDLVFKADHIEGLSLLWREPKFLEIKYKQARIFQFMNFWQTKDVDNFAYVVEVRETPLSQLHALSPSDRWEK